MGDEPRFSEKWDFRRKENDFEDSSSDDPDSNSTQDPIIHNPNLEPKQMDTGTKTVTREQPVKTRKRRSKKDETKPEKVKQVRRRKPKTVCVEDNKKKEEKTVMGMDGVGMFMETLLDDLTASRERLMDWMKTELCGAPDENVASRPPLKKRGVAEEKSSEIAHNGRDLDCTAGPLDRFLESGQEMITPKEKSPEIAQSGGGFDCNGRPLDRFLQSGQGGLGRNYFQQQQEGQGALVAQTEMDYSKNETEMQKDHNFVTPFASQLSSSSSLQSFPVPSSLFPNMSSPSLLQSFPVPPSLFASSSQGITPLASNTNFQMRQPVAQTPDLSEFQTGVTGGQGFENSMFHNNGYFSGFPAAFQPNLMAGGYNFPAQLNSATSSQQRDDNNMFGGLMMAGGAIRFSGNRFPEPDVSNCNNGLSDYRTTLVDKGRLNPKGVSAI